MKKAVSLILALCMVISLLPAMTVGAVAPGITIKYDIAGTIIKLGIPNDWNSASLEDFTYEETGGFFNYSSAYFKQETKGRFEFNRTFFQVADGMHVAFEIYVPQAGTYDMKMYHTGMAGAISVDVFVKKGAKSTDAADKVGTYDCNIASSSSIATPAPEPSVISGINFPEAGKYVVTFLPTDGASGNTSYKWASIGSFELVSGDGSGDAVIANFKDSYSVAAGSTVSLPATGHLSSDACGYAASYDNPISFVNTSVPLSFSSSAPEIATVNPTTGVVTGVAQGTAVISAAAVGATVPYNTTVTVTDPNAFSVKYDIARDMEALNIPDRYKTGASLREISYDYTNGFYSYAGSYYYDGAYAWNRVDFYSYFLTLGDGAYTAFEVYVPKAGTYDLEMQHRVKNNGIDMEVYVKKDEISINAADYKGTYSCKDASASNFTAKTSVIKDIVFPTAGSYVITFLPTDGVEGTSSAEGVWATLSTFSLVHGGAGSTYMGARAGITKSALSTRQGLESSALIAGETTTATVWAAMSDNTPVTVTSVSDWQSSNPDVLTIDAAGNITAVSTGTSTISKTVSKGGVNELASAVITVADPKVSANASFVATSNIDADIEVFGIEYNGAVDSEAPGTDITVIAPDVEGYEFQYWKRGAGNGRFINTDATYSFKLVSNTYLTAVYAPIPAPSDTTKKVMFFNQNGECIDTIAASGSTPVIPDKNPTLTGYTFDGWYINNGSTNLVGSTLTGTATHAVAKYTPNSLSGTVTVDGSVNCTNPEFGKEIVCSDDAATCWKRGGKIVAFGDSYTYYAWGATAITSSNEAVEALPLVVLESGNGAYMIEYDSAGYELVEAGIIFGTSDSITLGACYSKAASIKNASHGQFTAKPFDTETHARGYLVYKDGGATRIIYSK